MMMMDDHTLPAEFAVFQSQVQYVRKRGVSEWSSTCPRCGGSIHPDGSYPDRFVMLLNARGRSPVFAFCRRGDYVWWPGKEDDGQAIDPATLELLRRQAEEAEKRRQNEVRVKLASFTTQELWVELNRRMSEENRQWWRDQGIPDDWQDYLQLGFIPDKVFSVNENFVHSPAYTIPYFHGRDFLTMQYRLTAPDIGRDKYHFEQYLGAPYYMVTPMIPVMDKVIVCEGAKKAIVSYISGGTESDHTLLGVASKNSWRSSGILEAVKHCKRVYICLDPDCWQEPENARPGWLPEPIKFGIEVGKAARIVELPMKVDDAFLRYNLDEIEWKAALQQAKRL